MLAYSFYIAASSDRIRLSVSNIQSDFDERRVSFSQILMNGEIQNSQILKIAKKRAAGTNACPAHEVE